MKLLLGGFLLVSAGAILPFLMVIRVLDLSLSLAVLSYTASLSGLLLGIVGAVNLNHATSHDYTTSTGRQTGRLPGGLQRYAAHTLAPDAGASTDPGQR